MQYAQLRVLRDGSLFVSQYYTTQVNWCRVQTDRSIQNCTRLALPGRHRGFDVQLTDSGIRMAIAFENGSVFLFRVEAERNVQPLSNTSLVERSLPSVLPRHSAGDKWSPSTRQRRIPFIPFREIVCSSPPGLFAIDSRVVFYRWWLVNETVFVFDWASAGFTRLQCCVLIEYAYSNSESERSLLVPALIALYSIRSVSTSTSTSILVFILENYSYATASGQTLCFDWQYSSFIKDGAVAARSECLRSRIESGHVFALSSSPQRLLQRKAVRSRGRFECAFRCPGCSTRCSVDDMKPKCSTVNLRSSLEMTPIPIHVTDGPTAFSLSARLHASNLLANHFSFTEKYLLYCTLYLNETITA